MTGFTTMVQHHRRLMVRVVAIGFGGLLCLFLFVTLLFSIVSMKASHQLLSSSSSRRIIPAGSNKQNQKIDTTTTTVLVQNQEHNKKMQNNNQKQKHAPIVSSDVMEMCARTLWHTMSTTTIVLPDHQTFIHTGDIDDLWLRDSAAQVHPLLLPLVPYYDDHSDEATTTNNTTSSSSSSVPTRYVALVYDDPNLDRVVAGLIRRHAFYIRHDPYANAFRIDDSYVFSPAQKLLGRHDLISTWNYELDSGCYYTRLLYYYWRAARTDQSTAVLNHPTVREAVHIMIDLWIAEQRHEDDAFPTGPLLDCQNCGKPYRYPGLARDGKGTPTNASSGLTWTGFRPSDDECHYHFLIPANMMCVTVLEYVMELSLDVWHDEALHKRARSLQRAILRGIQEHGIVHHPTYGAIYAYEVDGWGIICSWTMPISRVYYRSRICNIPTSTMIFTPIRNDSSCHPTIPSTRPEPIP
jgi:meiotically up-regulated gene 157 (Mug157) protein